MQRDARRGARRVRHHSERLLRSGAAEAHRAVQPDGRGADRRHEAHLADARPRRVHDVPERHVRRDRRGEAAEHAVQPVHVQHTELHARRAVDQQVVGVRVPAVVELQHEVFRVDQHQVPVRRGLQVRHQSVLPGPRCAASGSRDAYDLGRAAPAENQKQKKTKKVVRHSCSPAISLAVRTSVSSQGSVQELGGGGGYQHGGGGADFLNLQFFILAVFHQSFLTSDTR